jgi:hypothetical protein
MKLSKYNVKHIFCVEGNWSNDLKDKASIITALEFLKANADINFIRRDCSTPEQFNSLLTDSLKRAYKKYGIIYLAFHGSPGQLHIGNRKKIDFECIAETLNGEAQDKIIHFGSCSTLNIPGRELSNFRKKTGAIAISGYTTDIDFIQSTVLDILYFKKCQEYRKISTIEKYMKLYYGKLMRDMGFKMNYEK